jgi:hypothetical protein
VARIDNFVDLIEQLTLVSQESWIVQSSACLTAFASLGTVERLVAAYLEGLSSKQRAALFDGSHETSTHFKWLVHRETQPHFTVWLHEYKSELKRTAGYAEVPHDHRYNIASLIMRGGYTAVAWEKAKRSGGLLAEGWRETYSQHDIMALTHDKIHSLAQIEPGTLTLLIEGPPIKGFSSAYYPGERKPRTFPDFPTRWPDLILSLNE